MKKSISLLLSCLFFALTACSHASQEQQSVQPDAETYTETESSVIEKQPSLFDGWVSNTVISTGCNYMTDASGGVTYRTYFPVEEYGELEYQFYFSNTVDSTWERGRYTFAGKTGGDYTIISAHIGVAESVDDAIIDFMDITFDGNTQKSVTGGETFWSDSVTIDIPENHYLVWEWTLEGTDIPCIRMSELAYSFIVKEDALVYNMDVPSPQLIGTKRNVKKTIACFGDSITQGAQTTSYAQSFWVSELFESLGSDYSIWNLGIGYARASDAALCGDWLERAKSADIVTLAFGTNDLVVGQYGASGSSSADEIENWLRTLISELQSAGCHVIVCNAPPFDFDEDTEIIRTELNTRIPVLAEEMGCDFFDWNSLLANPDNPAESLYGGHPNDEGCRMIANAFLDQFSDLLDTK